MGSTMTSEVGGRDLRAMRHLNKVASGRIDDTVWSQCERAKEIVAELKSVVYVVAAKLLERKRLIGDEVRALLITAEAPPRLR